MPKDEFDFEDPFELNGMSFPTDEDTTVPMAETFIEEFLRMGYDPGAILSLFRDPHYLGPNMAFQTRGETFVRGLIEDAFACRGRAVRWQDDSVTPPPEPSPGSCSLISESVGAGASTGTVASDPMGGPAPILE